MDMDDKTPVEPKGKGDNVGSIINFEYSIGAVSS